MFLTLIRDHECANIIGKSALELKIIMMEVMFNNLLIHVLSILVV